MSPPGHLKLRGLVTLAMLKSLYDRGQDHLDMFGPLVLDAIRGENLEAFKPEQATGAFGERHGIRISRPAMRSLLERLKRRGYLRREGGRYFANESALVSESLEPRKSQVAREHEILAERLIAYARSLGRAVAGQDDALGLLLTFLEENQIAFVLDDPKEMCLTPPPAMNARDSALIARFITNICLTDSALSGCLRRMLEGFILQNALLLRDIGSPQRRFHVTAFLDTRFLFGALGLHGPEEESWSREALAILRSVKVHLNVFDKTVDEMKGVLDAFERHLGTTEGLLSLRPGQLTDYFREMRWGPSDVRQARALLEHSLAGLGVSIRAVPNHARHLTHDEAALAAKLAAPDRNDEQRVAHDVDCVAAVLTLRGGEVSDHWEDCKFVFATTTQRVVCNVADWYRGEGESGLPPVVNLKALVGVAALKSPADTGDLKLHELVALCAAAMKPAPGMWQSFVRNLRSLEAEGKVTSDEAVAIVVDDLTSQLLIDYEQQIEEPEDADARTLTEMVERVRQRHSAEADERVAAVRQEAAQKIKEAENTADARIQGERDAAAAATAEKARIVARISRVAAALGAAASWTAAVIGSLLVALPVAGAVYGLSPRTAGWGHIVWVVEIVGSLVALLFTVFGGSVAYWRCSFRRRVEALVLNALVEGE